MIPIYFPRDTYDKLFVKIIAASIEDSIVAALDHVNVDREKEKFNHKDQ